MVLCSLFAIKVFTARCAFRWNSFSLLNLGWICFSCSETSETLEACYIGTLEACLELMSSLWHFCQSCFNIEIWNLCWYSCLSTGLAEIIHCRHRPLLLKAMKRKMPLKLVTKRGHHRGGVPEQPSVKVFLTCRHIQCLVVPQNLQRAYIPDIS